jgi:hypothetical protein
LTLNIVFRLNIVLVSHIYALPGLAPLAQTGVLAFRCHPLLAAVRSTAFSLISNMSPNIKKAQSKERSPIFIF